jgi:penicillin-binding protein 1C
LGRSNTSRKLKRALKRLGFIGLVVFLIWYAFFALHDPLFTQPTSTVVFASDGSLLGGKIAKDEQWRFPMADSISPRYVKSLIEFEDAWFYQHPGVNPVSMFRALSQNLEAGRVVSGGSTLSMQLIRMSRKNPSRTIWEKLYEIILATRLELRYSKAEILNLYAANAPFGGNTVGIGAAAYRYFGRNPADLSWAEAATLAVLPNAPGLIRPGKSEKQLLKKRNRLLEKLYSEEIINETTYELAVLEPLPAEPYAIPQESKHLIMLAQKDHPGRLLHSSIEVDLQKEVNRVLESYQQRYSSNGVHNAAAMLVDVESGAVVAYAGNYNQISPEHGGYNDMLQANRSSGSILKPFLYASMLDAGEMMPKQLQPDIPIILGGFKPENYLEEYDGAVPADAALYRSLNIPAVLQLRQYGVGAFKKRLLDYGFNSINRSESNYGLSLILGGGEVKGYDLANAYYLMAKALRDYNTEGSKAEQKYPAICWFKGQKVQEYKVPNSKAAIYHTFEALKKLNRPDSELGWQFFNGANVAWKTGTSFGFRDAWAVGVTNKYVAVVWIGNADGEGRPGLIGAETAGPLLFDILNYTRSAADFPIPLNDMLEVAVCTKSGYLASRPCPTKQKQFIASSSAKAALYCPNHAAYLTELETGKRVHRFCSNSWQADTFFVLPPVQARYYSKKNSNYRFLPDWKAGCQQAEQQALVFLYPKNNSTYYLPFDLDGKQHSLVAEVGLQKANQTLYWQLDGNYLGTTEDFHQLPIKLASGKHTLTVTDANGNSIQSAFEVLGNKSGE